MRIVAQFNPTNIEVARSFNVGYGSGIGRIVVSNHTAIDIQLTFTNGDTFYCEAGVSHLIVKEDPKWVINWTPVNNSLIVGNDATLGVFGFIGYFIPNNLVTITAYDLTEHISEIYPQFIGVPQNRPLYEYAFNGQMYSSCTQRLSAATAINAPMNITNENGNGKIGIIIISMFAFAEASSNIFYYRTLTNPNYTNGGAITSHNNYGTTFSQPGGSAASVSFKNANEASPGSQTIMSVINNSSIELLTNGNVEILAGVDPSGNPQIKQGITLINSLNAVTHWGSTFTWIEVETPIGIVPNI